MRIDDRLHWPDIFLRWGSTSGQYEVRTYPLMAVVAVVALLNSVHILQKGLSISYVVSQINFLAYLALDPLK